MYMMNLLSRYKGALIVIGIIALGFVAYSMVPKGDIGGALSVQAVDPAQGAVEQELITLLLQLRSIKLDLSLFDNAEFQTLQDFSQEPVPEAAGRPNPFAPLE